MRHSVPCAAWLLCALSACTSTEPKEPAAASPEPAPVVVAAAPVPTVAAKPEVKPAVQPEPAKVVAAPLTYDEIDPPPPTTVADPGPVPPEIPIQPWSSVPHAATWSLRAEPEHEVALVLDLYAGVLGRSGERWVQIGADGQLATVEMDRAPKLPVVGVWPSDAWFVDERMRNYGDGEGDEAQEVQEIRLMKLRGGNRWVPQVASCGNGEQWFHPGTDDWYEAHASTQSGMLMYTEETFSGIERVAGRHDAPDLGLHRGRYIRGFLETGKGEVYVLSSDTEGTYAVVACSDEDCVRANTRKLPLSHWKFGRRVARGKHAVSIVATEGDAEAAPETRHELILHFRSKGGWLLDELPRGERPNGMWSSEEGGLWTLTGDRLRWRDTESVWHDVAVPEGLSGPTVALSEDGKLVFVSGVVAGAPKIFSTEANAPAPAG